MPRNALEISKSFAAGTVNERDPDSISNLIAQLNQDLAALEKRPQDAVIDHKSSAP